MKVSESTMNKFWKLMLILECLSQVSSQEIEYYPSQSALNTEFLISNRILNKRQVSDQNKINYKAENNKTMNNMYNYMRRFNDQQKVKSKFVELDSKIKRAVDPVFHGHPKTREELWNKHFLNESSVFDQTPSLIKLLYNITTTYLNDCTPIILYDEHVEFKEGFLLQNLFKAFPVTFVHGRINDKDSVDEPEILVPVKECLHFIVFLADVKRCGRIIGMQASSKVVVVARSSQWAVQEFLASSLSRKFVNLLVISQSFTDDDVNLEAPYILYTHKLFTDGLGASKSVVLTSWTHGRYTRNIDLFPPKMTKGYAGHRFVIAAANQPPYIVRRIQADRNGGNPRVVWDGIEIRILNLLAERNNFSIEIIEPQDLHLGPGDAVAREIAMGRADVGIAGMYLTTDRKMQMDMSFPHSQDCAAFITLMSTALPRYRAILGPFHWHVWVALTFTYLFGIIPLAFSDKHTLRHLIHNSGEIENMFWYVFGTFTNCFTFVGKNSWSKTTKITTRLLIGWYWIFTIIITSCYTGSIIAFVTLPVYPSTVDSVEQLMKGFYRVGTLDRGGWERWFINSSDPITNKLFRKIEFVQNIEAGIRNTTKAFFWPYAFLGSKAELEYLVQANFSISTSKRAVLHISNECFVPFSVSMAFPNQSLYTTKLSNDMRRMYQGGLLHKIVDEVRWEIQRSGTGKLLSAKTPSSAPILTSTEEKGLTLADTQGMFLLMAAGFAMAGAALLSEWMGGCTRKCRLTRKTEVTTSPSADNLINTPESNLENAIRIHGDSDSRLHFESRDSSAESRRTLDGQVIQVSRESIIIHDTLNTNDWVSRRSSSVDLDREVREIFDRDLRKRVVHCVSDNDSIGSDRPSVAFGKRIDTPRRPE